ncbi:MAG: hypothetical protein ACFFAS_04260 [Promethearchaeota archaeon]
MSAKKESKKIMCCVKNCQKKISKEKAIIIEGNYFCGACAVTFYRSTLKF